MGLAFSTKYNALLYGLFFFFCLLFSLSEKNYKIKKLFSIEYILNYILFILGFIFTFLIFNFTVLLDWNIFWSKEYGKGFLFQFENVGNKKISEYPDAIKSRLLIENIKDFGIILTSIILLSWATLTKSKKWNRAAILICLYSLIIFIYITTKKRSPSHYYVFLHPLIAMMPTYLALTSTKIKEKYKNIISILFWLKENVKQEEIIYYYNSDLEKLPYASAIADLTAIKIDRRVAKKKHKEGNKFELKVKEELDYFYLFIGDKNINKESIFSKEKIKNVDFDLDTYLQKGELVFESTDKYQYGPEVFIFKVKQNK